jgi:ketosteroid isomerase-like protein
MQESSGAIAARLLDAFAAADLETALGTIHPRCVVHEPDAVPYAGEWRGRDGFGRLAAAMADLFEVSFRQRAIIHEGDVAVMRANVTFTSRATGRAVDTSVVEVCRVEEGLVVEADVYYKNPEAIRTLSQDTARADASLRPA